MVSRSYFALLNAASDTDPLATADASVFTRWRNVRRKQAWLTAAIVRLCWSPFSPA